MKKYLFIIAAAATCMLVACSKEKELRAPETTIVEEEFEHLPGWTYISATGGETATAASIDGTSGAFAWNTGDQIALFANGAYQKSAALASSFNNQASAEFAFEGVNAYRSDFAVFPADLVFDGDVVRANSATNHSASALTITLPASYPITKVKDDACPTPMIAVNEPDQPLAFKSLCAILRVTLTNVPKQTTSIDFVFGGKKVNGEFTLNDVDLSNLASFAGLTVAAASSAADSVISVTGISLNALTKDYVVNVPVPAGVASTGEYTTVTVTTRDSDGHKINSFRAVIKTTGTGKWVPTRIGARKLAVTLPVFTTKGNIGMTSGKKVVFAPGNLQATLTTKPTNTAVVGVASNWKFAEHQYSYLGANNGNIFASTGEDMDLFAWIGNSADPAETVNEQTVHYVNYTSEQLYGVFYPSLYNAGKPFYYAANDPDHPGPDATKALSNWYYFLGNVANETLRSDWGQNVISDGQGGTYPAGTWRTPGAGDSGVTEWQRIIASRKYADKDEAIAYRYAKVQIKTNPVTNGVILFPDFFSLAYPSWLPQLTVNNGSGSYTANELSLDQWELLESAGCVFLPAASWRRSSNGIKIDRLGDTVYWSNLSTGTAGKTQARGLLTNDLTLYSSSMDTATGMNSNKSVERSYGCAVRLIRDVN